MTHAELRNLLADCVVLWGIPARLAATEDGIALHASDGVYRVLPASPELRPVRWFLQTPERASAHRPPRALPSMVALLAALRNALGAERGASMRVGGG